MDEEWERLVKTLRPSSLFQYLFTAGVILSVAYLSVSYLVDKEAALMNNDANMILAVSK